MSSHRLDAFIQRHKERKATKELLDAAAEQQSLGKEIMSAFEEARKEGARGALENISEAEAPPSRRRPVAFSVSRGRARIFNGI